MNGLPDSKGVGTQKPGQVDIEFRTKVEIV
jgi:hypothetical protein